MSDVPPVAFAWEGDAFRPAGKFWQNLADKHYVIGERYKLVPVAERSQRSHQHYFSCIADAHANMPERLLALHPSPEALRKHALIRTGWCDQHTFIADSVPEAKRLAKFLTPIDEFSLVMTAGRVVTRYVAKSQNYRTMNKADFQKSKDDVLDWIAKEIGVERKALEANSGTTGAAS